MQAVCRLFSLKDQCPEAGCMPVLSRDGATSEPHGTLALGERGERAAWSASESIPMKDTSGPRDLTRSRRPRWEGIDPNQDGEKRRTRRAHSTGTGLGVDGTGEAPS